MKVDITVHTARSLSLTKETFLAEVEVLFNVHVPVPRLVLVVEDQFAPVAEGQGDPAHLGTPGQHGKEKKCLLIKRRERETENVQSRYM